LIPWDFARGLLNYDTASFAGVTSIGFFTLMWEFQSFFITLLETSNRQIDPALKRFSSGSTPGLSIVDQYEIIG
jgi:hypothetical protein